VRLVGFGWMLLGVAIVIEALLARSVWMAAAAVALVVLVVAVTGLVP